MKKTLLLTIAILLVVVRSRDSAGTRAPNRHRSWARKFIDGGADHSRGDRTSAGGARLSIAEAEAIALRNNPQITIGKLRALEARQYVRETGSALLPTASLNVTGVDSQSGSRIGSCIKDAWLLADSQKRPKATVL